MAKYITISLSIVFLVSCGDFIGEGDLSTITGNLQKAFDIQKPKQPAPSLKLQLESLLSQNWGAKEAPNGNDRCAAVTVDEDGAIYCAGETSSSLFDTAGSSDVLAFKVSPKGELLWATQVGEGEPNVPGDTSKQDICTGIAYHDKALYCAGFTRGTLGESSSGGRDCVALKFNAENGDLIWLKQFPSISCRGIAANSTGVYLGGHTSASIAEEAGGSNDVLITKLNHKGETVWHRQLGAETPISGIGDTSGNDQCRDIAVDNEGGVYCGGTTTGNLKETKGGGGDIIMVKYNTSGELQWVSQVGEESYPGQAYDTEICWTIALSSTGAICGGRSKSSIGDTNTSGPGGTNIDASLAYFDKNTGESWAQQIGSSFTEKIGALEAVGSGVCDEVATDSEDNIYCGGRTRGSLFDQNAGGNDFMVYKLSPEGKFIWGSQLGVKTAPGDATAQDSVYGMAVKNGQVYLGGDTSGSPFSTNAGGRDVVLFTLDSKTGTL